MAGTTRSLASRAGSYPSSYPSSYPVSPERARLGALGARRSAPVLGWAEPAGLIPHG